MVITHLYKCVYVSIGIRTSVLDLLAIYSCSVYIIIACLVDLMQFCCDILYMFVHHRRTLRALRNCKAGSFRDHSKM